MNRWLGVDVKLREDGALAVERGDLALIRGENCLLQALVNRLRSAAGDLIMHPNYGAGLPGQVGQPLSAARLARLKALVRRQLLSDPRALDLELDLWGEGTSLYIKAVVETVEGQVEMNQVFPEE